mmetsp:Transcript_92517/g.163615  ORF Transcript_92517/g.163615 Transcript_92517/m.163615 type:complete len:887 (+) Transcript_92517:60-2720(+)
MPPVFAQVDAQSGARTPSKGYGESIRGKGHGTSGRPASAAGTVAETSSGMEAVTSCTNIQRHVKPCMVEDKGRAVQEFLLYSYMKSVSACFTNDEKAKLLDAMCNAWLRLSDHDVREQTPESLMEAWSKPLLLVVRRRNDMISTEKSAERLTTHSVGKVFHWKSIKDYLCAALSATQSIKLVPRSNLPEIKALTALGIFPLPCTTETTISKIRHGVRECNLEYAFEQMSSYAGAKLHGVFASTKLHTSAMMTRWRSHSGVVYHSMEISGASYIGIQNPMNQFGLEGPVSPPDQTLALSCMNPDAQYCDDFVNKHFDLFRSTFLRHYGVPICNALEQVFGDAIELWLAPTSLALKRSFVTLLKEQRAKRIAPALHGTRSSNFTSIFEHGLLIPGQGNELKVANGSYHGLGIYTANLDAPWLAKRFCSESRMLVCAVVQSSAVTHVLDAQVVFDASHVVPLFVGTGKTFLSEIFLQTLPLPEPLDITTLLDASLGGDLVQRPGLFSCEQAKGCFRVSKQKVFYIGISFMLEDKHWIMYGTQCWVMSGSADWPSNSNMYVQVYFDGQQNPFAVAADQLSNTEPGLPGNFGKGDDVFLLSYQQLRRCDIWFWLSLNYDDRFNKMTRGRGSHGKVIGSAHSANGRKVQVQFDGEQSPVQVSVDDLSRVPPDLTSGYKAHQVVFYKGRMRKHVGYGQRGCVLCQCSEDRLLVQFQETRMDVMSSELTIHMPAYPAGLHIGCMVRLTRTIAAIPYNDRYSGLRHPAFFFLEEPEPRSLVQVCNLGVIRGFVSDTEALVKFQSHIDPICVSFQYLESLSTDPPLGLVFVKETRLQQIGLAAARKEAKKAAKQQREAEQRKQRQSNKSRHLQSRNSASMITRPSRMPRHGCRRHR